MGEGSVGSANGVAQVCCVPVVHFCCLFRLFDGGQQRWLGVFGTVFVVWDAGELSSMPGLDWPGPSWVMWST